MNCRRLSNDWHIFFGLVVCACVVVIACLTVAQVNNNAIIWTYCFPVAYASEIGICQEVIGYADYGFPVYSDNFPVRAYITFRYWDVVKRVNSTVVHQSMCGTTLDNALTRAKEKYPREVPILCAQNLSEEGTFSDGASTPVVL